MGAPAATARTILTTDEVAALLRQPPATVKRWRHTGTGPPSFRMGRAVYYDETDLWRWVDERRASGVNARRRPGRR